MMRHTRAPVSAEFVYQISGNRDLDGKAVSVLVEGHKGTRYTAWSVAGVVVYRRRYSGRNLALLKAELSDLRQRLVGAIEFGSLS